MCMGMGKGMGKGYGKAGARVMVAEAWQEWWQGRGSVVVSAQDRVVARSGGGGMHITMWLT